MSPELIVLIIILGAIILFSFEIFSVDVTALLIMGSLMITGILTTQEAVAGFSNPATLTVLAMLIISAGLQNTGLIYFLGQKTIELNFGNESLIIAATMISAGTLSAFMNNTAVVAIFLPMTLKIAGHKKISPNKLLMALSFGAMLGGSCTLIGSSTNLLVSNISDDHGLGTLGMFDLTPIGVVLLVVLTLFLAFWAKKTIKERKTQQDNLTRDYDIQHYLTEIIIPETSPYVGMRLSETGLTKKLELEVLQIVRSDGVEYLPEEVEVLKANDRLLVKAKAQKIISIKSTPEINIRSDYVVSDEKLSPRGGSLIEVIIGPNSGLVQHRLKDVDFKDKYQAIPLAIRGKEGLSVKQLDKVKLSEGYTLLLEAKKESIEQFYASEDFIVLREFKQPKLHKRKAILALSIVCAVILSASIGLVPILVSAWLGCLAMFITKVIRIQKVYSKVDWKIFFLLAGLIPLGTALEKSGVGELIATFVTEQLAAYGPEVILSSLFIFTCLLSGFISNNAVAVLVAPIAITVAQQLQLDPKPFLLTIVFAANTSFLTPVGYQTNTLIYGAGQYKFIDFFKTGGLMTLLVWLIITLMLSFLYF